MTENDLDDIEQFEAKETSKKLPVGWLLLFWGLIAWGAYYLWAYSPGTGGFTQGVEFNDSLKGNGADPGSNIFATILFTALPTLAAIGIAFAQKNKKKS